MGISFKIPKKGARYQPKLRGLDDKEAEGEGDLGELGRSKREADKAQDVTCMTVSSTCSGGLELPGLEEYDVSFTLNLFQKGFIIGKPTETENLQSLRQDGKSLHPYDRASETLFSAIQTGCLPGDSLDDIPSKFINGTLVCEVHDYRKCLPEQGTSNSAADVPVVHKVRLHMSLENVVKDIPLLSDDSWTYSDLMEVEARIVKALQPQLDLDPTPKLDRLCADPCPNKLDLGIGRKRPWQTPEVTVTCNAQTHGKKVCVDGVSGNDNSKPGDQVSVLENVAMQVILENTTTQHAASGVISARPNNFAQETARPTLPLQSQTKFQPAVNVAGVNANISSPQNLMNPYSDSASGNVSLLGKRENPDAQIAASQGMKRSKQTQGGLDGILQHQLGSQFVGLNTQDVNWKNQLLRSQLDANGTQYSTISGQRYPPQAMNNVSNQDTSASFYYNQHGMRYAPKEEQIDTDKLDSKDALAMDQQQARAQQLLQQPSMRNHLPPLTQWNNPRPLVDTRNNDMLQKRKGLTSPRVSSGPMVQSPVSSKSGEISSGSANQFSAVATTSALGSQKATANSNAAVGVGVTSATSSPSDSVHRQPQVSAAAAKRKSNSATKTQAMSGVGSPASVSNMTAPLNANSPSIGTAAAPIGDQIERFAKIDLLTQRYQLNLKKTKVDQYPAKKVVGSPAPHVAVLLNNSYNAEDFTDEMKPMSRSLVGGNFNICKIRTMEFMRSELNQAVKRRMVMAEKPIEGTVYMQYGDADGSKFPNIHDPMLILPTTNQADLLAAQFCALIVDEDGYQRSEDQIQTFVSHLGSSPPNAPTMVDETAPEIKQEILAAPSLHSNLSGPPNSNSSQNLPNSPRMLASASQPYFQRAQQLDQTSLAQQQQIQQQLQQPQIPRPSSMLSQNPLSQLIGQNPMLANKSAAHLQMQMLQQQQQQQQQNPMQRKVMMGLNNNMAGLGGLGNIMGMGGLRPMSGLRSNQMNMGPGQMSNFGSGIRPSSLTADQAAAMAQKLKQVQQNRAAAGIYGGIPNSMLGHAMNRANINLNQLQRNALASMGPPKIPGQNFYQQQLSQQQQQQLQQQLNQQQQQLNQQQQQHMSQQLSSGALQQQMNNNSSSITNNNNNNNNNAGNVGGAAPVSPQLSPQTHNSVGSITSSPMEQMQGSNKSNNA